MDKDKKEKKHFFKDFKAELKKVIWPTPKQLVNNTIAVVTIVIIVAVIVFALDFIFGEMNSLLNRGVSSLSESMTNSATQEEVQLTNTDNVEVVTNSQEVQITTNSETVSE